MNQISRSFPVMSLIYAWSTAAVVLQLVHDGWQRVAGPSPKFLEDFDLSDLTLDDLPS